MHVPKQTENSKDVLALLELVEKLAKENQEGAAEQASHDPERDERRRRIQEIVETSHRVADSEKRRRRILSLVQEALSQLRLDMKYLCFDLEATRNERDQLQARLDDREAED